MRIVGFQNIDGSWSDAGTLVTLSHANAATFAAVQADSGTAFATALAVAILRRQCAERESAWRLVERKALVWLTAKLGGAEAAEALIARVIALL
jgi:hypothetical protein